MFHSGRWSGEGGREVLGRGRCLVGRIGCPRCLASRSWTLSLRSTVVLSIFCQRCVFSGNDVTEEISPIEAGLTWTIGKSRREACAFLGGDRIKRELAEGVKQKRIGLLTQGPPARAHSDLLEPESGRRVRSHKTSLLHLGVCLCRLARSPVAPLVPIWARTSRWAMWRSRLLRRQQPSRWWCVTSSTTLW